MTTALSYSDPAQPVIKIHWSTYCLVNRRARCTFKYAAIIQHDVKGISALSADCRPPVLRMIGSVNPKGDLTHPAISGFYEAYHGKAV